MDRKSIGPYLENLKKNNLMARDKGEYVPTFWFSRDLFINIGMFGESFVPELDKIKTLELKDRKNSTVFDSETLIPDKPYQQKRSIYLKIMTLQHIDHFMSQNLRKKFVRTIKFEFSNQMAAFVTRLSIY
jgi:hypothetical protein